MSTRRKLIIAISAISLMAGLVAWWLHNIPSDEMSDWLLPNQTIHIEWSDWDLAPGDPEQVVIAYGSFGSTLPKIRCSELHCLAPTKGKTYMSNAVVSHIEFPIPASHLTQVKTFLADPQTTCISIVPIGQHVTALCTNPAWQKFLFYGVS